MNALLPALTWALAGIIVGITLVPMTRRAMNTPMPAGLQLAVTVPLTAALFGAVRWRLPSMPEMIAYCAFAAFAISLATVDMRERRLPKPLMHATFAAVVIASMLSTSITGDTGSLIRAAIGMVCSFAVYLAIAMAFAGDLGAGDVRLAGIIGWITAWHSWSALFAGALLGTLGGCMVGVAALMTNRGKPGHLPAAPTMLLGALLALIVA
jgi:leader peptidase (prepilin peptidase)/N-methyltransferase